MSSTEAEAKSIKVKQKKGNYGFSPERGLEAFFYLNITQSKKL
jgi:hypothetical protein